MSWLGADGRLSRKRKAFGAFFTPHDLAKFLSTWAIETPQVRVLEPCFGGGALIDAILKRFAEVGRGDLVGVEVDKLTVNLARRHYGDAAEFHRSDFLATQPKKIGLVDAVVANPPFTRNHSLSEGLKSKLRRLAGTFGITGAPGIWVYFLCHSLAFLKPGGRVAFIVPGAASFANYSRPLLRVLAERFKDVELVHVEGRVSWEGGAQERAMLLLASGYAQGQTLAVRESTLTRGKSGEYQLASGPPPLPLLNHRELGDLAKIEIGCVTGSNKHFLIDASVQSNLKIADEELTPTIARARHIVGLATTQKDVQRLAFLGERTLLLSPRDIANRGSGVRAQLATVPREKRKKTLWFKKRNPWWQVAVGPQAHAVFTYMNHLGPRIAMIEPGVAVTNTLHKVHFKTSNVEQMRAICVSMLTTYTQLHAEQIGRIYGGGVLKFELSEARRIPILLPDHLSKPTFKRIDAALRSGAIEHARRLADKAILPFFCGADWESVQHQMEVQLAAMREQRGASPS